MNNKFILSLGYDENVNEQGETERALVFKIWEFISLDSKLMNF